MTERPSMRAVLSGALMALFVGSLTNSVVGIALPTIAGELGGQGQVPWVASSALLTMTVSTPLWGKGADRTGPRPLLLGALVAFMAGSVAAGVATGMSMLIAGRAIQGVGAGGILALTNALVAGLVPARERGRYTSLFGVSFGTASVAGPLIGGFAVGLPGLGWRWCFLGVVPFAAVAVVLVRRAPHRAPSAARGRVDFTGGALLAASAASLVILLSVSGRAWPWLSWWSVAFGLVIAALAVLAVLRQQRAPESMLPPRLFRSHTFTVACGASFLLGAVMFGGLIYLPQYLQLVRGHGAGTAGLLMLPQVGTMIITSMLSGYLVSRTGRWKIFPSVGCTLLAAGLLMLCWLTPDTAQGWLFCGMALLGAGTGMAQQVLVLIAQNSVNAGDLGVASSTATFSRTLGGAVGVAAFGAIINVRLRSDLPAALAKAGFETTEGNLRELLGTPERIARLPGVLTDAIRTAYSSGLGSVFLVALPLALLALTAVLSTRETRLMTES